ncbi:DUF421 domain-containing protein [Tuberibacillus sp. Marseille-P3662]|uniref:DUF421 domain-containing protein n=1 Tax=Tuberibacillus sp. Marseille-P3662 TaxID=1965358 RepID=UPI000A1C7C80|nr:DUF421 domain-containing protein [Tuberibacillus sp. Marseille-P3662]
MGTLFDLVITPVIVFIVGLVLLRFTGKKAVSQMTSFDLLFVLILGTVISEPIVTKTLWKASVWALVLTLGYFGFTYLVLNNKLRWKLNDSPTVLIRNGDIDKKGLKKIRMTTPELISQLRIKGYENVADVEMATLEDVGEFSVIPKARARPLQPKDIQLSPSPTFIPIPIILDGQIIDHNLKYLDKNREWLEQQLIAQGYSMNVLDEITLAAVNQQGTLDVDSEDPSNNDQGSYAYKPGQEN